MFLAKAHAVQVAFALSARRTTRANFLKLALIGIRISHSPQSLFIVVCVLCFLCRLFILCAKHGIASFQRAFDSRAKVRMICRRDFFRIVVNVPEHCVADQMNEMRKTVTDLTNAHKHFAVDRDTEFVGDRSDNLPQEIVMQLFQLNGF